MAQKAVFYLALMIFCLAETSVYAQHEPVNKTHKNSGLLDFNGYYDSRNFSVFTLNILAQPADRLQYFSLTNYQSTHSGTDLQTFYSEQNVRLRLRKSPLDLTSQWVVRSGEATDRFRLGIRIRLSSITGLNALFKRLHLSYSANFHLLEFGSGKGPDYFTQIEHVYRLEILPDLLQKRIYLAGFADQNIIYVDDDKPSIKWVSEHQMGLRIFNQLFMVMEYRINDFLPSKNYGLGYGLEYKIIFKEI